MTGGHAGAPATEGTARVPSSGSEPNHDTAGPQRRPLEGVRVLEAATFVSAPFGALMLSDLGAEVVKVEPPRATPTGGSGGPTPRSARSSTTSTGASGRWPST